MTACYQHFFHRLKTRVKTKNISFIRISCRLRNALEETGTAREARHNNIIGRMRIACWINKATGTQSE